MRLQSLKHLLDVVHAVARPQRVCVLGSSSLLPHHPDLGDPGQPLELTFDADFLVEPVNEAIAESLQLAAGQESAFMAQFGYYIDILRPIIVETLPAGWESRLAPVLDYTNTFALNPYDLALVKLIVGRKKDLALVRMLLDLGLLDADRLRQHYRETPLGELDAMAAGRNLHAIVTGGSGP